MRPVTDKSASKAFAKGDFVNRARVIAKRAMGLPGMPVLPIIALSTAVVASISGAFGTDRLDMPQRSLFWLLLMAVQSVKWLFWLSWQVKSHADYWRAALIGTPLLALFIPFEIWLIYQLMGRGAEFVFLPILLATAPIGATILLAMAAIYPPQWLKQDRELELGILEKQGLSASRIIAVSAEDHYCRLYLDDGRTQLVSARLKDIIAELSAIEGTQIHRSHWIADAGVSEARRVGRAWELILPDGTALRVSSTYRKEARQRGWLSRRK